jgi:hypothetical protein
MSKDNGEGLSIIKSLDIGNLNKIDANKAENLSSKVLNERETRRRILTHARLVGMEKDMLLLFAKFDKLMRNCTNEQERVDIAKMGAYEVYRLLGGGGELYVDGQLVAKDD